MGGELALGAPGEDAGHSYSAGARPASECLSGASLPDPHRDVVGSIDPDKLDVGASRKGRVHFDFRTRPQYQVVRDLLDESYAMRIAHGDAGDLKIVARE